MGSLTHFFKARTSRITALKSEVTEKPQKQLQEVPESAVFYLLSTLKLVYQAQHGKVTLEKLSKDSAINAILDAQTDTSNAYTRAVDPHGLKHLFYLKVCAVCWERHGDGIRIKALPDAASVRFIDVKGSRFEAQFYHHHPDQKRDDGITPVLDPVKVGLNAPKSIMGSLENFFTELGINNKHCLQHFGRQRLLAPDNFSEIFTQHEHQQLNPLLQSLHAATRT